MRERGEWERRGKRVSEEDEEGKEKVMIVYHGSRRG